MPGLETLPIKSTASVTVYCVGGWRKAPLLSAGALPALCRSVGQVRF